MLVFLDGEDGHPKLAGVCDVYVPEMPIYEFVCCDTPTGRRNYRLGNIGFGSRQKATPLTVLRLAFGDNPQDLPSFREAEGWA